jgi:hypothetical protein
MEITEIIENLKLLNNWRRDNENKYIMPEPKQIGLTIDCAIKELSKLDLTNMKKTTKDKSNIEYQQEMHDKIEFELSRRAFSNTELEFIHNAVKNSRAYVTVFNLINNKL